MTENIDNGLPEICEKCNRDCPEPCEAFKRFVAVKTWLIEAKAQGRISMSVGFSLDEILEGLDIKGEKVTG